MVLMEDKSKALSSDLAQEYTDWAAERTRMASTRTFMALLRTGLAIAGGGTLITALLVRNYPDWLVATLSGIFIIVGFPIMLVLVTTVLLQVAIIAVLILFLLG